MLGKKLKASALENLSLFLERREDEIKTQNKKGMLNSQLVKGKAILKRLSFQLEFDRTRDVT